MRYCPGCGGEIEGNWDHCTNCGEKLSPSTTEPDSRTSAGQESSFPTGRKIALGGLVLVILGAFLPWVSVSVLGTTDSVIGINTLGILTLIIAALAGFVGLLSWSRAAQTLILLASIGIAIVALFGISNPTELVEIQSTGLDEGLIHPDIGLYATLLGGVLAATASGYAIKSEDETADVEDENEDPSFFTLYWLPGFSK